MANQTELTVEVEEQADDATQQGTEAQDVADAAPEPSTPEPAPPIAAATPEPTKPPPPELTDDECDALLTRHGWDAEAVRNYLIKPELITRAKGCRVSTFDQSYQEPFDQAVHFAFDPNSQAAASLWANHVNIRVDRFYLGWKELRAVSGQRETVRLAKMFEQQLIAWAALPVAQKISPEQVAAAQARVVSDHAAMARTVANQFPEMLPSGRLAMHRRVAPGIRLSADGEGVDVPNADSLHPQVLEQIQAEAPVLIEALKAERTITIKPR